VTIGATTPTGGLVVNLPSGYTANTAKTVNYWGSCAAFVGGATHLGIVARASDTSISFYGDDGTAIWDATNPVTFAAGNVIDFDFTVPVNELSSNTTLANRAVEEYLSVASGSTTPTVSGLSGSVLGTGRAGVALTLTSQTTVQPTDSFVLEFRSSTSTSWAQRFPYYETGSSQYGAYVSGTTATNTVSVAFAAGGRDAGTGNTWDSIATFLWRVRKVSGGASVGYPISAKNVYGATDGVAPASGMVGQYIEGATGFAAVVAAAGAWGSQATVPIPSAGEWKITATYTTFNNGAVTAQVMRAGVGTASGDSDPIKEQNSYNVGTTAYRYPISPMAVRVRTTAAADYYVKFKADSSTTNLQVQIHYLAERIA
jgi:hypothetical protein